MLATSASVPSPSTRAPGRAARTAAPACRGTPDRSRRPQRGPDRAEAERGRGHSRPAACHARAGPGHGKRPDPAPTLAPDEQRQPRPRSPASAAYGRRRSSALTPARRLCRGRERGGARRRDHRLWVQAGARGQPQRAAETEHRQPHTRRADPLPLRSRGAATLDLPGTGLVVRRQILEGRWEKGAGTCYEGTAYAHGPALDPGRPARVATTCGRAGSGAGDRRRWSRGGTR
jgi:hypothetical protein